MHSNVTTFGTGSKHFNGWFFLTFVWLLTIFQLHCCLLLQNPDDELDCCITNISITVTHKKFEVFFYVLLDWPNMSLEPSYMDCILGLPAVLELAHIVWCPGFRPNFNLELCVTVHE